MRTIAQWTSALLALGLAGSWWGVGAQVDTSVSHQYFVPVRVAVEDPKLLRSAIVQMCALDWATYRRDPSLLPMFHDLTKHSGCGDLRDSSKTFKTTFGELEDEYLRRGCAESGRYKEKAPGCVPAGLVFHESRCGSTLSANMLAALPYSVVYSESSPPVDVAWAAGLSQADQIRALRVVLAAMGRPIAAAAYNGVLPPGTAEQGWSPRHMYLKMQSSLVPFMHLFRRAFPETPWVFIHREPVEVLASLLRNALQLPAADAGEGAHVSHTDRGVREAPCMRHRGPAAPAFIKAATGAQDDVEAIMAVPPEEYCAAAVAELCATALHEASSARLSALRELGIQPPPDLPLADGAALAALLADDARVSLLDGMLLNRTDGTGTVRGVGQAVFVEYTRMPHALLPILQRHFAPRQVRVLHPFPSGPAASSAAGGSSGAEGSGSGDAEGAGGAGETSPATQQLGALDAPAAPDVDDVDATLQLHRQQQQGGGSAGSVPQGYIVVRDVLSDADVAEVLAVAGKYSKARGRTGKADSGRDGEGGAKGAKAAAKESSKHLTRGPSLDKEGHFVADSEDKQGRSWPSLKVAAGKYLRSLRGFMLAFNIENGPSDGAVGGSDADVEAADQDARGGARRRWNSGFNVTFTQADAEGRAAAGAADAAPAVPAAHHLPASGVPYLPAADARMLPIGGGYPWHYPLQDMLTLWNADVTTLPASHGAFQSLRTFDFADPAELAEAELYRRAEVPFVIRNVPSMADTVAKWASDEHLVSVMGAETVFMADVNDDNHFMYYHKAAARLDKGYKPPTEEARVKAPDWLKRAHEVATAVAAEEAGQLPEGWAAPAAVQKLGGVPGGLNAHANNGDDAALAANGGKPLKALPPMSPALGTGFDMGATPASGVGPSSKAGGSVGAGDGPFPATFPQPPQRPQRELWYMRASTNPRMVQENKFIHDAFPVFDATKGKSFFVVDPKQQRGIHCRFGMPGIIAEDHYDSGRNFIFMVRGRKRYILSRPSECDNLAMLRDGPSARHSAADWTLPEGIAALRNASGIEVVMEAGDALYIPAFWFHFIESLTVNIQCNARSGTPPMGAEAIADCGFDARYTEHAGVDTDATPPAHHLAAVANIGAPGLGGRAVLPGRELLGLAAALASAGSEGGEPVFGPSQLEKESAAREAATAAGNDSPAGVLASALSNMQQAISSTVSSALGLGSSGAGSGSAQQQQPQTQHKVGNSAGVPGGAVSAGGVVPAKQDSASQQPPPGLSAEEAAKHQQQAAEQAAAAAAAQATAAQHAAAAGSVQQPSTSAGLEGGAAAASGVLGVLGLRPVDHTGKPIGPNAFENAMTKAARASKQQGSGGSTLDTRHYSQVLDTVLLLLALGGCATLVISVRRRWWAARSLPCLPTSAASPTGIGPKRPDGASRPSVALATGVVADGQRSRSGSGNGVALAVNGGSGALFHRGVGALGGGNGLGAVAVKMDRSD